VKAEGIPGLYAGLPGSLISGAAQGFGFNYWHSFLRQLYISYQASPQAIGTPVELSIAYGASALSALFTVPITLVTTKQQTSAKEERKGLIDTAKDVIQSEDGVIGLWKGFSASLLLCVNPAITYGAVERLRIILFQGRTKLQLWESFGECPLAAI
jgi:Mitochondrial carrier protein